MKLIVLLLCFSFCFGKLPVKEFSNEKELEIRILEKIFSDITGKRKVKVYLLGNKSNYFSTNMKKYSKNLKEIKNCKEADIVFLAGRYKNKLPKSCYGKVVFSSRRKDVFIRKNCIGAFFWKKGRPNILFIREKLNRKKVKLPSEYDKFIESLGSRLEKAGGKEK